MSDNVIGADGADGVASVDGDSSAAGADGVTSADSTNGDANTGADRNASAAGADGVTNADSANGDANAAAHPIIIPAVGESVSEAVIASWLVADGATVREGAPVLELETDKATLEVPAPASGVVAIGVAAGSEVPIGQQVGSIAVADGAVKVSAEAESPASSDAEAPASSEAKVPAPSEAKAGTVAAAPSSASESQEDLLPLSPAVRRIAAEHGIDMQQVNATGKGGRATKGDMLAHLQERDAAASVGAPAPSAVPSTTVPSATATAAPAPSTVPSATAPPAVPSAVPSATAPPAVPSASASATSLSSEQRSVPLSRIRRRIAENLVRSKQQAAHLTTFNEIDMTEVMALRSLYKEEFERRHGIRVGFMSFFIKASCQALRAFPSVHAFLEDNTIIYNERCHIGVALAADKGLIVPVIRAAEGKSFADIEAEIKEFARAAKEKRLSPDALRGGTFTITNGGVFGSLLSTPIPNPPQTAILGMHAITQRPAVVAGAVVAGAVVARPMMYVALTYDHRLIDGKDAVGFLKSVKESVEQPARLMLEL